MRNVLFVFCLTLSLVASSVHAQNIPLEWSACETSADCGLVTTQSCGPNLGINLQHKEEAQKEICKTPDACPAAPVGCDSSAIPAYAAICKDGQCIPDYDAPAPPAADMHYELKNLELKCPDDNLDCGAAAQPK